MRGLVLFAAALTLVRGCSDTSDDCAYYKEAGYCETYGDTLKEMCAKTCGFCGGSGGDGDGGEAGTAVDPRPAREPESMELCRDTCSSKDCAWYKNQGHCEKYSAVMVANCASTCGWCGARLCSPPRVENGWTDFEMIMIPNGATVNVNCYEGFTNMGSAQLTCNDYGEIDGSARCEEISKDDGSGYPVAEETACQRAAKSAMEASYVGGKFVVPQVSTHYVPQCDDYEGNYKEIQYDGGKGESFCVDIYRGTEVQGTRIQGQHEYISCAPGSAKEYYDRLAQENEASSYDAGASYVYNYDTSSSGSEYNYDTGASSYDTGASSYDTGASSYDYGYDNSASSYDYSYGDGESSSSGGDSGYDAADYSTGGNDGYYVSEGDDYYSGEDDYYVSDTDYYAPASDSYAADSSDYYMESSDDYSSGDYYGESGSGDDYYASSDGFDNSYYYAQGDETEEEEEAPEVLYSEAAVFADDGAQEAAAAEGDTTAAEDDSGAKEDDVSSTKDARRRARKRRLRNKRDADAELADE